MVYLAGSGGAVAAEEASSIEERGVVPFETFLVNLSDPGGNRFLKATIQVVVESEAEAKHVEANAALMSHARWRTWIAHRAERAGAGHHGRQEKTQGGDCSSGRHCLEETKGG